ncbi:TrbI/VirB10 family protein [Bradyrhizobium sp.]|uniref:TrbI/VirB10 family protein n=1 Tax=Bradyrhizobium sp. TaxID=376 RepID=UPI001EB1AB10|nr:TrbI/VirB10 family protein [Bradyrhizobium sp.]MBV9980665.1 TrbI/VirB10 family protein [Bradyrhizobium sp.]
MGKEPHEGPGPVSGPTPSSADATQALRLHAERPRIARLSRKVLAGGTALVLVIISGAVLWALKSNQSHIPAPDELYSTDHHNVADGLTKLPQDYSSLPRDVPRLGPPLPGDFGRPIASPEGQSGPPGLDAEQQSENQETEAARTSKVFAPTTAAVSPPHAASQETPANTALSSDEAFAQNGQDRKLMFVNAPVDRRTTAPDRISRPASPFVVQAGTVIPAALITGIRSDLPGQITAQVTENVYDTPTGRARLIPQGARLIGVYDSQVAFGQSRVLLVWTRLIMPNGRSIVLERQPGADATGYAGLEDDVDYHWKELLGAAALSTLLGVGSELGSGADNGNNMAILQALRLGAANSLNQTGQQVVRRNLDIQPTLTIRPGFPVRVIVNRDLVLEAYRG